MEISSTTSSAQTSGLRTLAQLQSESRSNEMDKDAFLNILVTQLSNQNPLEPTSDTEFIAQLAQFTMLEQLQNLSATFSTSQSFDLVGKYVYVENESEGSADTEMIFGKVDGVVKRDGIDYLLVGDEKYNASDVVGVMNSLSDDSSTDENILQSANLIGKVVTAAYSNEDGELVTVTGTVEKITIRDQVIYACVDEREIEVSDIHEISEQDNYII